MAACDPKAHYYHKQPDQDDRGIIHIGGCDGQLGREADESANHDNEQWRKVVTDVACVAKIEGSGREGGLSASGGNDTLGDGICDALCSRIVSVSLEKKNMEGLGVYMEGYRTKYRTAEVTIELKAVELAR